MKILRLRLKNLNSFKKEIELDFRESPLNEASLFAITGPTGSGKTTLLDAMCVALYGKTPRLDGQVNQSANHLLSQGKKEGFAELIFEAADKRYLSEWRAKRNSKGDVTSEMKLIDYDTGVLISDKKQGRDDLMEEILGLKYDAFLRSIMLAQGNFQAFLKANADEKRQILEKITGIEIYEELKRALNEKRRDTEKSLENAKTILEKIPEASQDEIDELEGELKDVTSSIEDRSKLARKLEASILKARQREESFQRLNKIKDEIASLEKDLGYYGELERSLALAEAAARIRTEREQYLSRENELLECQGDLKEAEEEERRVAGNMEAANEELKKASGRLGDFHKTRDVRLKELDSAHEEEIKAKEREEQAKRMKEKAHKLKEDVESLERTVREREKAMARVEREKARCQAILDGAPSVKDPSKVLVWLEGRYEAFTRLKTEIQEREASLLELTDRLKNEEDYIKELFLNKDKGLGHEKLLEREVAGLKDKLEEMDISRWITRRETLQKTYPLLTQYNSYALELRKAEDEHGRLTDAIEKMAIEMGTLEDILEKLSRRLEGLEDERNAAKEEAEGLRLSKAAHMLRRDMLRKGEPCPVCGSKDHPNGEGSIGEVSDDGAEALEARVETLESIIREIRDDIAKANQRSSDLKRQMEKAEADKEGILRGMTDLKSELSNLTSKWRDIFPGMSVDEKVIRDGLTQADTAIEEHNRLLQDLKDKEGNLGKLEERLQNIEENIKKSQGQRERFKRDEASQKEAILRNRGELETIHNEILGEVPEKYHALQLEGALAHFKKELERIAEAMEGLTKACNSKELLLNKLEAEKGQLVSKMEEHDAAVEEFNELVDEATGLMCKAKSRTGGISSAEAKEALEEEYNRLQKIKEEKEKSARKLTELHIECRAVTQEADKKLERAGEDFEASRKKYLSALAREDFSSMKEHEEASKTTEWMETTRKDIRAFQDKLNTLKKQKEGLEEIFKEEPYDEELLSQLIDEAREMADSIDQLNKGRGALEEAIKTRKGFLKEWQAQRDRVQEAKKEYERWARLHEAMPSNTLRDFALKMTFDALILYANKQLEDLTHRYQLQAQDMKDMVVMDMWNAGEARPVETLSGGESFLASLALALALTEMSQGRTSLKSLFLDEGFGTLDAHTLDTALSALEGLRSRGKTIGLISHVQELTRRVPTQIQVRRHGSGTSDIEIIG